MEGKEIDTPKFREDTINNYKRIKDIKDGFGYARQLIAESSLYGFMTFAQKGAIAIAAVILGMILTNIGFEPNQDQTQETLSSLKALMSLIPLIGVSISLILVYFYPIDRNFHKKLIEDIENRKIQNV